MPAAVRGILLLSSPGLCSMRFAAQPIHSSRNSHNRLCRDLFNSSSSRSFSQATRFLRSPQKPNISAIKGGAKASKPTTGHKAPAKRNPTSKPLGVSSSSPSSLPSASKSQPIITGRSTIADYTSYEAVLRARKRPVVLYEAPSHVGYTVASYAAAVFFFGYASWTYYDNVERAPVDIAPWVPKAFMGAAVVMSAIGGYLVMSPARLVRRITVHPTAPTTLRASSITSGLKERLAAKPKEDPLVMVVELSRMVPFKRTRSVQALPEELSMNYKLYYPPAKGGSQKLTAAEKLKQAEQEAAQKVFDMEHIMTLPFRQMGRLLRGGFQQTRRALLRESFLKLKIKDKGIYRLDISGGWALDDGRALDRLIKTQSM